jgi:hypothetical protein
MLAVAEGGEEGKRELDYFIQEKREEERALMSPDSGGRMFDGGGY